MRRFAWILPVLLLFVLLFAACDPAPKSSKLLIIGIDGCMPAIVEAANTPNMDSLMQHGTVVMDAHTIPPTISGVGWTSMMTGVWQDKHKVEDNYFKTDNLAEYPQFFTRLEEADPSVFTASVVRWFPVNMYLIQDCDYKLEASTDTDAEVLSVGQSCLEEPGLDVMYLHFGDVDIAGHRSHFGTDSERYLKSMETMDGMIGELMGTLARRQDRAEENWMVMVVTDHGGKEKKHGGDSEEERRIFMVISGDGLAHHEITAAEREVMIVDVAPTALRHFGVEVLGEWGFDGEAVEVVTIDPTP